jgi:hypothetical protein
LKIFPAANERLAVSNFKKANKKSIIVYGSEKVKKLVKDFENYHHNRKD